jgi:site-specific DNA recombinase
MLEGRKTFQRDEDQWIEIPVPPIISEYMFQQAQNRLDENAKHSRRKPKRGRFYLLRGMIFCVHCRKPYVCQAISAGKNRRLRPSLVYRHRLKEGHCMNMQLNANPIEADVWRKVVQVILNPEKLLEGYQLTHEQSQAALHMKREHLRTLHEAEKSLKDKRTQLNILYSDVQVNMSREEYLEGRLVINEELESIGKQIEETEAEIADIPTPADLETFARFTAEVREYVLGNIDPPVSDKRRMLELLNVKVWIDEDGNNSISGSFPQNSDDGTRSFKWTQ